MKRFRKVTNMRLNPFKEEIDNKMKGKFKLLGHIGVALFLVSALMLAVAPAAKVEAATVVTDVWVEFPYIATVYNEAADTDGSNIYIVHFKPATALTRGVDTVTVTFPDGTTTMGPSDSDFTIGTVTATQVDFSTTYDSVDTDITRVTWIDGTDTPVVGGYRIKVTPPINIAAGQDVWVRFTSTGIKTTGTTEASTYKVYVSTSQDITAVLSSAFSLGDGACANFVPTVSPGTAGAPALYTFAFNPTDSDGDLTGASGKVSIMFPVGTTLPSSIAASAVEFAATGDTPSYTACGVAPTVDTDRRIVTATTPVTLVYDGSTDCHMKIASSAGITNPTIAADDNKYFCMISTSEDSKWVRSSDLNITGGTATQLLVANGEIGTTAYKYSDSTTMVHMYSDQIFLLLADQYGNGVDYSGGLAVTITPSTGATVYTNANVGGTSTWSEASSTTIYDKDPAASASSYPQQLYFKAGTAGTYTITFTASEYTSAEWTVTVCPVVSLYDSNDSLVKTYGPTAASTANENAGEHSGDYITNAIAAAMTDDTVKLGDGTYEVDAGDYGITLNKAITLTSVNGADSTTLDGSTATVDIIYMTGANATLDGLTIKGSKTATTVNAIDVRASGFTIQNNKLVDIPFDMIFVNSCVAEITSGTITNNTIIGIGRGSAACKNGIIVESSGNAISEVKVTNNTISANYGQESNGIGVAKVTGTVSAITVQGNTISGCYRGISLYGDVTGLTGTKAIANNTITGCVYGVKASWGNAVAFDLVKNTITGHNIAGVYLHDATPAAATIDIKYNDLSGNGKWGIYNTFTATDDYDAVAKYNWWGDATGPGAGTGTSKSLTAHGSGDNVTVEVTWEPWLHKSLTDVVADNASYQAAEMKLVLGCWNTLSTPVQLIEAANSIDELISEDDMTIGYYYDATTGWQVIETGYVLSPCDAVYIKMKSTASTAYVLFKFDAGAYTTPSKDLYAGWNLISLAYLSSSGKQGTYAVASVALTAANLPGYAQVVSPSLNDAQRDMYYTAGTGTSWSFSSGETTHTEIDSTGIYKQHLYPGLGYWIYMQNACTLAGFEITPIAPAFGLD